MNQFELEHETTGINRQPLNQDPGSLYQPAIPDHFIQEWQRTLQEKRMRQHQLSNNSFGKGRKKFFGILG